MMKKKVALVLASGGSRGLAHIGAIDVLQENGYEITSVSGCSMGALVGGLFAAGGLDIFREWMKRVDRMKVLSMMDLTIGSGGFVKGDKIIEELRSIIPDKNIEDLEIPFTAVATDIRHRREVVFDKGSLYEAIRSSISMPSVFTPHRIGDMLLVDGGVVNPIPLDRVKRTEGDILVAVDLNAPYEMKKEHESAIGHMRKKLADIIDNITDKKKVEEIETASQNKGYEDDEDMGFVALLNESSALMLQCNSERSIALYPPDILIRIAKNAYGTMEFYKFDEIVQLGRDKTLAALQEL